MCCSNINKKSHPKIGRLYDNFFMALNYIKAFHKSGWQKYFRNRRAFTFIFIIIKQSLSQV